MIECPKAYYEENENLVHHLKLKKGDVGRYIIMPGDPKRCEKIAKRFDSPKLIADFREYATWTGYIDKVKVSAVSHGIGGPSTAIALEELIKIGADTFIRVGTCGGMNIDVLPGDIVIVNGAIKLGGTMDNYIPKEFPCIPNIEVLEAMIEASKNIKNKRYITNFVNIINSLQLANENLERIKECYEEALNEHYRKFMKNYEHIYENYLVYYMFKILFPCNEESIMDAYIMLVIQFAILKMNLIGVCGHYKEEMDEEKVVNLIQSYAVVTEHDNFIANRINKYLKENNLNTLAHMFIIMGK